MFCFIKTQLFFFCVLLPTIICSQNVFEEFEGIPVSIYPSIHNHNNFQIIEELGAFAVCEKDLDLTKLSTIGQTNLKVIPYNRDNLSPQAIHNYSTGHYSFWEVEDSFPKAYSFFVVPLKGEVIDDEANTGRDIVTNLTYSPNEPFLIGPGYTLESYPRGGDAQDYSYYVLQSTMKIQKLATTQGDENILKVKVEFRSAYSKDYILIDEFIINESTITTFDIYDNLPIGTFQLSVPDMVGVNAIDFAEYENFHEVEDDDVTESALWYRLFGNVRYVFSMLSPKFKVYIDNFTVSDGNWSNPVTVGNYKIAVENMMNYYAQNSSFDRIVGWHTADEPFVYDAYHPQNKINDFILEYYNPNNNDDVLIGGETNVTVGTSISKKSYFSDDIDQYKLVFEPKLFNQVVAPRRVFINRYPYDYPRYKLPEERLDDMHEVYKLMNEFIPDFGFSLQTFGSSKLNSQNQTWLEMRFPSNKEILYHMYTGLIHGAKEMKIWCLNSYEKSSVIMNGLINIDGNWRREGLKDFIKDDIIGRLSGNLGKTLKTLKSTSVYPAESIFRTDQGNPIEELNSYEFIHHITYNDAISENLKIDVGIFEEKAGVGLSKYFMILNRPTNDYNIQSLDISLSKYGNYNNFSVYDHSNNCLVPVETNELCSFEDFLNSGDGVLYEFGPTTKIGGELSIDETLTANTSLDRDLLVANGVILTVGNDYTINNTLTIANGGQLAVTSSGNIIIENAGNIISKDWISSGLINAKSENHPKLIIADYDDYPMPNAIIERKTNLTEDWIILESDYSEKEFIDNSVSLAQPGGQLL